MNDTRNEVERGKKYFVFFLLQGRVNQNNNKKRIHKLFRNFFFPDQMTRKDRTDSVDRMKQMV